MGPEISPARATSAGLHRNGDPALNGGCVVVPAFNEEVMIGDTIDQIRLVVRNVVVVDDASSDRTAEIAAARGAVVLRHIVNRGQGAALQTGIDFAVRSGAAWIVTFDADGQHHASEIPALVAPILARTHDVVLGSRFLGSAEGIPWLRRIALRAAVAFIRLTSSAKVTDVHNGLRALSDRAAGELRITLDRMAHASEIVDQVVENRLRYTEVPVTIRYTTYSLGKGQSLFSAFGIAFEYITRRWLT
jgi:glycosyltransferase involved in cell wall biosynthesis